jgi:hypothetical protein
MAYDEKKDANVDDGLISLRERTREVEAVG